MKSIFALGLCILFSSQLYAAGTTTANGVISVKSKFKVPHTVDRLKTIIAKKGMKVMGYVDHANAAKNVGIDLPATELVIFGNPKIGSPLMLCARTFALDLPQKMLVWKDRAGQVWLSYNDPTYIADRHHLEEHCRKSLNKIAGALGKFAKTAGGMD